MIRAIIGVLGGVTAVTPKRIVDAYETVAIENAAETEMRSGAEPAIRAESALVAAVCLLGGRAYAWMLYVTGGFGAVLLIAPRAYREFASRLLYADPDAVVWAERFTPALRLLGALYLLFGLREFRSRRRRDGA
ncbi:hypothetical protein [Halorubrum sp. DTA46]|uniref:hypothetical protein n=1 Tax=Halorubrum sp. DTA46 TaxID=3402162 RepID=UPI003AAE4CE1